MNLDLQKVSAPIATTRGPITAARLSALLANYWLPYTSFWILVWLADAPTAHGAWPILGQFLSKIGNDIFIGTSLILLLLWGRNAQRGYAKWWWLDVIVCNTLAVHLLKFVTHLARPSGSASGFPSGHASFAFALAWLMLQTRPRLAPLWFAGAVAIGWARVEVHAHYPYQVTVGALLGLAVGFWVSRQPGGVIVPRIFARFAHTRV